MKRALLLLMAVLMAAGCSRMSGVAVDFMQKPEAVGSSVTVFSWTPVEEGIFVQDRCRVTVRGVWDSGEVATGMRMMYLPEDVALQSLTTYRWKVEVWDRDGHRKVGRGRFRTAIYPSGGWTARWIGPVRAGVQQPFFRKEFTVGKGLKSAILCITTSGGGVFRLNDKPVGGTYSLSTALYRDIACSYRLYDVTRMLSRGRNQLTAQVVGKSPALLAELHLRYKDGSHDILCTDGSWEVSEGSAYTLLVGGLQYDATVDSLRFSAAVPAENVRSVLVPDASALPVRERLIPLESSRTDSLRTFFFGESVRANCSFDISGQQGDIVELRYLDAGGKQIGKDAVILGRKGRAKWTDAFSEREFLSLAVVCPKSTKVKVQADVLQPRQPSWATLRGEVEGFVLDPSPVGAPFQAVDTLYTSFGDRALLEEAWPALESYLSGTRKKSLEEYTLMEKFARVLGKDAEPYAETRRIMTGK